MDNLLHFLATHYGAETMRPGLERVQNALHEIVPLFSRTKIITIAGTNGKGETTLRLSSYLKDHLHFVWVSPHVERLTERFRDQDGEIEEKLLVSLVFECHKVVQANEWKLSYYEFLFYVFCRWASASSPEYLLLEVGLGGRLDAVNIFDADLVLLPSVSRDHQEFLGHRYEQILKEKLGVLRQNNKLIHYLSLKYLSERADLYSSQIGAKVLDLNEVIRYSAVDFSFRNEQLAYAAYCDLRGIEYIPLEQSTSRKFLENRGEVISRESEWIFFGSHNVDGLRKLIQFLQSGTYTFSRPPFDCVIVAFSKRSVQDLRVMMKMLKDPRLGHVVVTSFDHPKAAEASQIEALSLEEGLNFVSNIQLYVQEQRPNQHILVTGSYYFLGHIKFLLR